MTGLPIFGMACIGGYLVRRRFSGVGCPPPLIPVRSSFYQSAIVSRLLPPPPLFFFQWQIWSLIFYFSFLVSRFSFLVFRFSVFGFRFSIFDFSFSFLVSRFYFSYFLFWISDAWLTYHASGVSSKLLNFPLISLRISPSKLLEISAIGLACGEWQVYPASE